jgi:RNA polymerase sigma-70 factor (ECF subfamily)
VSWRCVEFSLASSLGVGLGKRAVRGEAHCGGDPHAFGVIVSDHYRVLLAQAERRLGNRIDAEDAVQETFERAFRAVCRFGQTGEFRLGAWLSRILTNVCNDHGGRAAAERGLSDRVELRDVDAGDAFEHVSDPVVLRAVHDAIDALPSSQRDTFVLKEVDGLSYPQVADRLEISEDNARARVHRARTALQRSLALTRAALGAIVAIPVGMRSLFRRGRGVDPVVQQGGDLASAGSGHSLVVQLATSPIGQAVSTIAPSGAVRGSAIAALAGIAVTGALAVPAVTNGGSGAKPTTAERTSLESSAPRVVEVSSVEAVAAPTRPAPVAEAAPPTTTSTPPAESDVVQIEAPSWWDERVFALPPELLPSGSPCAYPDATSAQSAGAARVVSRVNLGTTPLSPTDVDGALGFSHSAPFLLPELQGEELFLTGQVCFDGDAGVLQADMKGAGESIHLTGQLVLRSAADDVTTTYIFRGVARAADGRPMPFGTRNDFIARLVVHTDADTDAKTAELSFAFYAADGAAQGEVPAIAGNPPPGPDAGQPPAPATSTTVAPTIDSTPATTTTTTTTLPQSETGGEEQEQPDALAS